MFCAENTHATPSASDTRCQAGCNSAGVRRTSTSDGRCNEPSVCVSGDGEASAFVRRTHRHDCMEFLDCMHSGQLLCVSDIDESRGAINGARVGEREDREHAHTCTAHMTRPDIYWTDGIQYTTYVGTRTHAPHRPTDRTDATDWTRTCPPTRTRRHARSDRPRDKIVHVCVRVRTYTPTDAF